MSATLSFPTSQTDRFGSREAGGGRRETQRCSDGPRVIPRFESGEKKKRFQNSKKGPNTIPMRMGVREGGWRNPRNHGTTEAFQKHPGSRPFLIVGLVSFILNMIEDASFRDWMGWIIVPDPDDTGSTY
jgi:hypothetical protein